MRFIGIIAAAASATAVTGAGLAGAGDTLAGGSGDDTGLFGGDDDDALDGGAGTDTPCEGAPAGDLDDVDTSSTASEPDAVSRNSAEVRLVCRQPAGRSCAATFERGDDARETDR